MSKKHKELLGMTDMFAILIVVMTAWVYHILRLNSSIYCMSIIPH